MERRYWWGLSLWIVFNLCAAAACGGGSNTPQDAPDSDANDSNDQSISLGMDTGHAARIYVVRRDRNRALSVDTTWRWNLWNLDTNALIASGTGHCPDFNQWIYELQGDRFLTCGETGVTLRNASDGAPIATVEVSHAGLREDGGAAWFASADTLEVRDAAGGLALQLPGDFRQAVLRLSATHLKIAGGPAHTSHIQNVRLSDGASQLTPFAGSFIRWFSDGEAYLSVAGTVYTSYAGDGTVIAVGSLNSASRDGSFQRVDVLGDEIWLQTTSSLYVFQRNNLNTEVAKLSGWVTQGAFLRDALAMCDSEENLRFARLQQNAIVFSAPTPGCFDAIGGSLAHGWVISDRKGEGVLSKSTSAGALSQHESLNLGRIRDLAGGAGRLALRTASKKILVFDAAPPMLTLRYTLADGAIALSRDGRYLAYSLPPNHAEVNIIDLVTTTITSVPATPDHVIKSLALNADGSLLLRTFTDRTMGLNTRAGAALPLHVTDGPWSPILAPTTNALLLREPDGSATNPPANARIYVDGNLTAGMSQVGLGWLDDERIIGATYSYSPREGLVQRSVDLFDRNGVHLGPVILPNMRGAEVEGLGADYLFTGNIVRVGHAEPIASAQGYPSSVVDDWLLYVSGTDIRALKFR